MNALRWAATTAMTVVALGCTPFHTASTIDGSASRTGGDADTAPPSLDSGGGDAGPTHHDATVDGSATDAEASTDASPPLDTVCGFPWNEHNCAGVTVSVLGSVQDSDDPRIGFARSDGGLLGICYAEISSQDFLTRYVYAITFEPPGSNVGQPTAVTLFAGSESDITPACAIGGGPGSTFHVVVNDTDDSILGYGELVDGTMPEYSLFGPNPIQGYLVLGVIDTGSSGVLAAVGTNLPEAIQSYVVTPLDGGAATFGDPVTVETQTGLGLVGAGEFSLRAGAPPRMLIDTEPGDAGSRVDIAAWNGTSWKVAPVEGAALDAAIGYSPSLAITDGGWRGVYYEQNPVVSEAGTSDAGTSQLHVATFTGAHVTITRPFPPAFDDDPESPLVGAAAAVGPDGRLFIAYVASSSTTQTEVLYLARPESAMPGAPYIIDTVDDQLSAADPPSVNLIVEPSGRVDIVYMRLASNSVYYATRDP